MSTTNQLADASRHAEKDAFQFPTWTVIDTGSNATLAASIGAKAQQQHFLTHFTVSFSAALAAAVTVTVKDGTTVIWQTEIGTEVRIYTENFETRPLHASTNAALVVGVAAAGSGVTQTISMAGYSRMQP